MSTHWGPPAHNFVPEYQQSGIPFVTSSAANEVNTTPVFVSFPFVTRWVQIFNTDATTTDTLRVGFTEKGVSSAPNANYMVLNGGQSTDRLELKCTGLWFLKHGSNPASFSVIAGLTNVKPAQFFVVTGSNGIEGVG